MERCQGKAGSIGRGAGRYNRLDDSMLDAVDDRFVVVNTFKFFNDNLRYRLAQRQHGRFATLFPNEASLLRLTSAVLVEIIEEWETGKRYLNMETD